ncbi:hypothetical protein MNBD_GAMMA26-2548 [hydrothermal vent metagenome]|uniref:Cytochrome c-552/4 domain-containing protein n=1 Tax=hydrothermal vent metagenome TaxID=652676 RepID=A0A3B1BB11_9ZZZZ
MPRHRRQLLVLIFIAISLVQMGCANDKEKEITIIYSGNLNGELEPCGCAEATNLGGIKRRATMIQRLRAQHPDLFLISSGGLLSSNSSQDHLKGEYILKGLATMDYDAVGLQWNDMAFGLGLIQEFALPWVASNWLSDEIPPLRTVERAGIRLAFFAWLDPHESLQQRMTGVQKIVSDDPQTLIPAMAKAKDERAITVLITTLPLEQALERIPLEQVDILLIQAINEKYGDPQRIGDTLVLQPGTRGMRLGRVDIVLNRNNKIDSFRSEVIQLPSSVPDAPELEAWYLEYLARGKEDFLQRAKVRKTLNSGASPYIGGDACKDCHAQAYEVWTQSKHAVAYETLKSVNKAYDPDCIGCHTVGFEQPGGFVEPIITYHLLNVQCESCHGPSRSHANSEGTKPVGHTGWSRQKMCQQCHVGSHSPAFEFEHYWPKIAH